MDPYYPNWYNRNCYSESDNAPPYNGYEMPYNILPDASFKDRLLGMLGNKVLFSVDARICGKETLTGSLCYVGCDFIIVNVCIHRKPLSMYVPINMIRFFALNH